MNEIKRAISLDSERIIVDTVKAAMKPFGYRSSEVRAGVDHDGDPVIFIEVYYDLSERPIDTAVTASLLSDVRDRLWNSGETRFPHIRHHFDEHQKVAERRRVRG